MSVLSIDKLKATLTRRRISFQRLTISRNSKGVSFPRQLGDSKHPYSVGRRSLQDTRQICIFYYFCRWRLRGRGTRNRRRRRRRRRRRGRKRSERIRPPFAFAVVKKAKSDRLSPDNKDSPKDKATLSPATERGELIEGTPRESLCFE